MSFLTDASLRHLTGYQRYSAQVRALRQMGIPHRVRPDGRPIVLAEDLREHDRARHRDMQPDFDAI